MNKINHYISMIGFLVLGFALQVHFHIQPLVAMLLLVSGGMSYYFWSKLDDQNSEDNDSDNDSNDYGHTH